MSVRFREARAADLPEIVRLLHEDALGRGRESPGDPGYLAAFEEMRSERFNRLIVGESGGAVVATYQIVVIPGVSLRAARRAQIEGVRVARALRGRGIGGALMADAEARARAAGAVLMQLTTNASRQDAHRFYERHGYAATHLGFKKPL